ncbi:concanavalin A-like lectin/glucanase [Thozetella sp. PMI_491]|nr:concanavalin A-like lectin/glucanase [Thozetella sp. PMI_491]
MSLPAHLSTLVLLISAAIPRASASPSLTTDSKCGCYRTNGSEVGFFSNHRFFDFRSLDRYQHVPDVVTDKNSSSGAPVSSPYFESSDWKSMWQLQTWNNSLHSRADAAIPMYNSMSNVYIEPNGDGSSTPKTWLTLRTQRLPGFQTAAEFASEEKKYQFLSVRMFARTIGASGACTAMFTYRDSPELATVQEADLEVLTKDPRNNIRYTNQPSYTKDGDEIEAATENGTMPNGLDWTAWAVHRLDWTPNRSTWYIDGQKVASISFQAPRDPSHIIFNSWSDGGVWTGNMTMNDAAYLQIQWIDVVFNVTDTGDDATVVSRLGRLFRKDSSQTACNSVCSIDETPNSGQPVLLWGNGATRLLGQAGVVAWIPLLVVFVMLVSSANIFL